MFFWAPLARHAKYARIGRVILVFIAMQSVLVLPVLFNFLRTPPDLFYPRIHGSPDFELFGDSWAAWMDVVEDEIGFAQEIMQPAGVEWPLIYESVAVYSEVYEVYLEDAYRVTGGVSGVVHGVVVADMYDQLEIPDTVQVLLMFTPGYIFYVDSNMMLTIPVTRVPAWVLEEMHVRELFNHLAIYNRYFSGIVMPVFLLVFIVFFISQLLIVLAAIWLFGQWRKLHGKMTVRERFSVITFASVPAVLVGMVIGFAFPIFHILIFQLLMIYISYKAMKEF